MSTATIDPGPGAETVDLRDRLVAIRPAALPPEDDTPVLAALYVTNPRGWRYKARHRRSRSPFARLAFGSAMGAAILGFGVALTLRGW